VVIRVKSSAVVRGPTPSPLRPNWQFQGVGERRETCGVRLPGPGSLETESETHTTKRERRERRERIRKARDELQSEVKVA